MPNRHRILADNNIIIISAISLLRHFLHHYALLRPGLHTTLSIDWSLAFALDNRGELVISSLLNNIDIVFRQVITLATAELNSFTLRQ